MSETKLLPPKMPYIEDAYGLPNNNLSAVKAAEVIATTNRLEIIKFNITDSEISRLKDYMIIKACPVGDKEGFKKITESRKEVKRIRISIEKRSDELKDTAKGFIKMVDQERDKILNQLSPIEDHLQAEEDKVLAEVERLKKEEEERQWRKLQERADKLAVYGVKVEILVLKSLTDEDFNLLVERAKVSHETEKARLAEEKRLSDIKAEEERIARLKKEEADRIANEKLNAERLKLAEEWEKMQAERKKLDDEKKAAQDKINKEAADKLKEEQRIREEKKREEDKIIADKKAQDDRIAEEKRLEALRPDKEKLSLFASDLCLIKYPDVSYPNSIAAINETKKLIEIARLTLLNRIKSL